jgi:hypothetical protein
MLSGKAARGNAKRVTITNASDTLGTPNWMLLAKKVHGTNAAMTKMA